MNLYTHKTKGGTYEYLGVAKPAGAARRLNLDPMPVYRDMQGQIYYRLPYDFEQNMQPHILDSLAESAMAAPAESVYTEEFSDLISQLKLYANLSRPLDDLVAYINAWGQQRYEAGQRETQDLLDVEREHVAQCVRNLDAMRARAEHAEAALAELASHEVNGSGGLKPYEFLVAGHSLRWYLKADVDAALASRPVADLSGLREFDHEGVPVDVGSYYRIDDVQARLSGKVEAATTAAFSMDCNPWCDSNGVLRPPAGGSVEGKPDGSTDFKINGKLMFSVSAPTASPAAANAVAIAFNPTLICSMARKFATVTSGPACTTYRFTDESLARYIEDISSFMQDQRDHDADTPAAHIAGDMQTTASADGLPPQPAPAPAEAVDAWRDLAARCLTAMKMAKHYGETGRGRPPQQTCMSEIEELEALLTDQPAQAPAGEPVADNWAGSLAQIIMDVPLPKRSNEHQSGFVDAKQAILQALRSAGFDAPVANAGQAQGCAHVWNDFGQLGGRNVSWCPRCDILAWTGEEPQAAQPAEDERAAFEAWARDSRRSMFTASDSFEFDGEYYADRDTDNAWRAYQAGAAIAAQQPAQRLTTRTWELHIQGRTADSRTIDLPIFGGGSLDGKALILVELPAHPIPTGASIRPEVGAHGAMAYAVLDENNRVVCILPFDVQFPARKFANEKIINAARQAGLWEERAGVGHAFGGVEELRRFYNTLQGEQHGN